MDYADLYNFRTDMGIIVPNSDDVLDGIRQRFKAIFGADIDLREETPVGRLVEAMAVVVRSTLGVTAQNANQFSVTQASGIYLDAIGSIFGMERRYSSKTVVDITVKGTSNAVVVPKGSAVMDSEGRTFYADSDIAMSREEGGFWYGDGTASAAESGEIFVDANSVTRVGNSVLGWIGVNNPEPARTIGNAVESDYSFRKRLKDARPVGTNFKTHLLSRLIRLDYVTSVSIEENNDFDTAMLGGVAVPGHSLFVCVDGGDSEETRKEIAKAIIDCKPVGTGMKHDESDIDGAQLVSQEVVVGGATGSLGVAYFYRPARVDVTVKVYLNANMYAGTSLEDDVRRAVSDYVYSIGIGGTVSSTVMAPIISTAIPSVGVFDIKLGVKGGGGDPTSLIALNSYQRAAVAAEDVSIVMYE